MPSATAHKTQDAIASLKADHDKVKKLFDQFEKTEKSDQKMKIVQEILKELKVHAYVEENIFYPAVRHELEDTDDIMNEADEEHHVAKVLIAELEQMTGTEPHWHAKVNVLAENIRHHIKEEEGEMLPKARKTGIDFVILGEQMTKLKEKAMSEGVPPDAETHMIEKSGVRGESPAMMAATEIQVPLKEK